MEGRGRGRGRGRARGNHFDRDRSRPEFYYSNNRREFDREVPQPPPPPVPLSALPTMYTDEERSRSGRWEAADQHRAEQRRLQEQSMSDNPQGSRGGRPPLPLNIDTRQKDPNRRSIDASPRDRLMDDRPPRRTSAHWPQVPSDRERDPPTPRDERQHPDRYRPRHGSEAGQPSRRDSDDRSFTDHSPIGTRTPMSTRQFSPAMPSAPAAVNVSSTRSTNEMTKHIVEAAQAYGRLRDAERTHATARSQKEKHKDHFINFPVMRDRYEGNLTKATQELEKAQAEFDLRVAPLDADLHLLLQDKQQSFIKDDILKEVREDVVRQLDEFTNLARRMGMELGSSTLASFVTSIVKTQVAKGPPPLEVESLKKEIRALRARDEKRERDITSMHDHFERKFVEMNQKWTSVHTQQQNLETTFKGIQAEQENTSMQLGLLSGVVDQMKVEMEKLRNAVNEADKKDPRTNDLAANMEYVMRRVDSVESSVKQNQNHIQNARSGLYELQSGTVVRAGAGDNAGNVTREEMKEAIQHQHEETWKMVAEQFEDNIGTLEELEKSATDTMAKMEKLWAELEGYKTNSDHALTELEKRATTMFGSLHNKFSQDLESLDKRVQTQDQRVDGLTMAVKHCDERMTEWSTKDFYDNLVHLIIQRNPVLLNQGAQLNHILTEHRTLQAGLGKVQSELEQRQRLLADGRLSHTAPDSPANHAKNGLNGSDSANGSSEAASISELRNMVLTLNTELENVNKQLQTHIENYTGRINDIREWTISVTKRMQGHQDQTKMLKDELMNLRQVYSRRDTGSPTLLSPALSADRWKAVSAGQDVPLKGLGETDPSEDGA